MTSSGQNIGSRNVFPPTVNTTSWGANVNRFLRSFANLNITKFAILPFVPHGTYLGGYVETGGALGTETAEDADVTSAKTGFVYSGVRRLPVMGAANNSIFNPTPVGTNVFGAQYVFNETINKDVPTASGSLSIRDAVFSLTDAGTFGTITKDEDYVVFDMSKTFVLPFDPQYPFITTPDNRGYTPFYEVCEIIADKSGSTSAARSIAKRYPTGLTLSEVAFSTDTPPLDGIQRGGLFCAQYYYRNGRSFPDDDISASSSTIKTGLGIKINPGVAHVMYIEFGENDQTRYTNADDDAASA